MVIITERKKRLKVLKYIYDRKRTNSHEIVRTLGIGTEELYPVINYLEEKNWIHCSAKTLDGATHMIKISADGIDKIEGTDESEYASTGTQEEIDLIKSQTDTLSDRFKKIEEKLDSMLNRKNRKVTYKITVYSLLMATFLGLAFSSFLEFLSRTVPPKYSSLITLIYYFLAFFSLAILGLLFDRVQSVLKIKEMEISASFDLDDSSYSEFSKSFEKIVSDFVPLQKIKFRFNGLWNGVYDRVVLYLRTKKETLQIREETGFKESDQIKEVEYEFFSDTRQEDFTTLTINFRDKTITINHDKGFNYDKALVIKDKIKKLGLTKYNFRDLVEEGY